MSTLAWILCRIITVATPAEGIGSNNPTTESTASISNSHAYHWNIQNLINFDRIFGGKHRVNAVALYEADQYTSFNSGTSAKGIPSPDFQFYSLGQSVGEITAMKVAIRKPALFLIWDVLCTNTATSIC